MRFPTRYLVKWKSLSHVRFFATAWTVACQAPLSMGIFQARIQEWVAMPSSRGSSQPRDSTQVSRIAGESLPSEPPGKLKNTGVGSLSLPQGIFLTQGPNQGLILYRWILYQLCYQESLNQKKEFCFQPDLFSVWNNWKKKKKRVGWGGSKEGRKNKSKKNRQTIYKNQVSVSKMLEMRHWNSVIPETENKSCPALWPPSFCPENARLGCREAESGRFPEKCQITP